MKDLPHHYSVSSQLDTASLLVTESEDAPNLWITAPVEFGGPGGEWSPETLLVASVASCFLLTFRAIANASKFDWESLSCDVVGVLERIDKKLQFTEFHLEAKIVTESAEDIERVERLLKKAEETCLITVSMKARTSLKIAINSQ